MSSSHWNTIGTLSTSTLKDPRLQLHWAAQLVASFGNALLDRRSDDSQSNLGWDDAHQALCSHPSSGGFHCALRPADLTLLLLDSSQQIIEQFPFREKPSNTVFSG